MSSMVLSGDTSGTVTVTVPAVAGTNTVTIPALTGTAVISGQNSAITAGTAQASTSGTSIDFTGIPSWVKRITVMFNGVSLSGTSSPNILIGPVAGVESTGYVSNAASILGSTVVNTNSTTNILLSGNSASAATYQGSVVLTLLNATGNIWTAQGALSRAGDFAYSYLISGSKSLAGTLSIVRITGNGTDTFDAGSINILYE